MCAIFAASDVFNLTRPSFFLLWLWHLDSRPEWTANQPCQIKQRECLELLRLYNAVVGESLKVTFQFLHHPLLKCATLRAWYDNKSKFCQLKGLFWQTVFVFFLFKPTNLIRGILFSLIISKPLLCICLSIQILGVAVRRSTDENKLLPFKKNGWCSEYRLSWDGTFFRMPECLFFASKISSFFS